MSELIYKIRVNRPCRLFIDNEEIMVLEESKLATITLPEGKYLRKVVAVDDDTIYDEAVLALSGTSKLEDLDLTEFEEARRVAFPKDGVQIGNLLYKINENGVSVYSTNKDSVEIVIPAQIKFTNYLYKVTSIENYAFQCCFSLASITIPNSVTSIGNYAFGGCSITSITIPDSVTSIGDHAFYECSSLTSITIPNSVTSIVDQAFLGCTSLTSINIPNSVTSIGNGAFYGCSSLISITIPSSVTSLGKHAFSHCALTSITIPNSVTSIGKYAFNNCKSLGVITYHGTKEQWEKTNLDKEWRTGSAVKSIHCTDGDVEL